MQQVLKIGVAVVKKQASVEGEQYVIFFCNASSRFHRAGLLSLEKKKKKEKATQRQAADRAMSVPS